MHRRTFLLGTAGVLALSAGCIGGESGSPDSATTESHTEAESSTTAASTSTATRTSGTTLSLTSTTASPGESGDLTIEARNIKWLGLPNPFDGFSTATTDTNRGKPVLDFEKMTANPRIEAVLESYPPQLQWSSVQRHVTVEIPYRVPEKSPAREYPYTVTASKSVSGGSESATKSASFIVAQK